MLKAAAKDFSPWTRPSDTAPSGPIPTSAPPNLAIPEIQQEYCLGKRWEHQRCAGLRQRFALLTDCRSIPPHRRYNQAVASGGNCHDGAHVLRFTSTQTPISSQDYKG